MLLGILMTNSFIIWGCSGHAKVLVDIIKMQGSNVIAFFDNQKRVSFLDGIGFYLGENGFNEWKSTQRHITEISGLVAIGGQHGKDRLAIQALFKGAGIQIQPVIHSSAVVSQSASIGLGSQVLAHSLVAAGCVLGEVCIVNHKASVDHECILGNGVHLAPGSTVCGCVNIGENVMVGAGAVVLPRLTIGKNTIIGAGAVVTKDVPENSVVIGNPAQLINHNQHSKEIK